MQLTRAVLNFAKKLSQHSKIRESLVIIMVSGSNYTGDYHEPKPFSQKADV